MSTSARSFASEREGGFNGGHKSHGPHTTTMSPRPYADIIFDALKEDKWTTRSHLAEMITKERNVLSPGALSKTLSYLIRSNTIETNRDGRFFCSKPLKSEKRKKIQVEDVNPSSNAGDQEKRTPTNSDGVLTERETEGEVVRALREQLETLEKHVVTLQKKCDDLKVLENRVSLLENQTGEVPSGPISTEHDVKARTKAPNSRKRALKTPNKHRSAKKRYLTSAVDILQEDPMEEVEEKEGGREQDPVSLVSEDHGIAEMKGSSCLPVQFANMIRGDVRDSANSQKSLVWHFKNQDDENAKWISLPRDISRKIQRGYETYAIEDRTKHTLVCKKNDYTIQYVAMLGEYCGRNVRFCRMQVQQ